MRWFFSILCLLASLALLGLYAASYVRPRYVVIDWESPATCSFDQAVVGGDWTARTPHMGRGLSEQPALVRSNLVVRSVWGSLGWAWIRAYDFRWPTEGDSRASLRPLSVTWRAFGALPTGNRWWVLVFPLPWHNSTSQWSAAKPAYLYWWTGNVETPYWPFVVLMLPVGTWVLRRHWRIARVQKRRKRGLCATCGYDLRAHTPNQRCPECGELVVAGKQSDAPRA
jgi:predicted RNA-binding Zn-ribbon protein involved in translation (DUF1610 family)